MGGPCCCLSAGVTPTAQKQLTRVMGRVGEVLPGSGTVLLVDGEGKVLWQQTGANDAGELAGVVTGLRRTSRQLGQALQQPSTPAIHVTGKDTLLSVYELTDSGAAIAVFRRLEAILEKSRHGPGEGGTGGSTLDTTEGDAAVQPVLEELRVLMANSVAAVI
ncbi:hypothetical protein T484DRAFT_1985348 [Baffinella frigidus]|nr:hypothetical protein T484DRAFT_1985348 [Cryptophyta sp. CCMP2293]|mmetsp:Transcript_65812/g.155952  ORF Transcript_65812/g.155952 Transcript_65812/m.155952 type:complete len:162 (-) Transcript_65812:39-524(-)